MYYLIDSLTDWFTHWSIYCLTDLFSDSWLIDLLTDSFTDWLVYFVIDLLIDLLTDCNLLNDLLND